jgi:hypothetical protein
MFLDIIFIGFEFAFTIEIEKVLAKAVCHVKDRS